MLGLNKNINEFFRSLIKNFLKSPIIWFCVILLPGVLYPIFTSGFTGDDTLTSLTRATIAINGQSIVDRYLENISAMASSRLPLLQPYYFLFLILGGNLLALKVYVAAIMIFLCLTLYKFGLEFGAKREESIVAVFIFVSCLQVRDYGDPIIAFYGITPLSIIILIWSIIWINRFIKFESNRNKYIANFFVILSSQVYEFNIVIIFFYFLILPIFYKKSHFFFLRKFIISGSFIVLYILVSIYLRYTVENTDPQFHSAYVPNLSFRNILITFIIQLVSSLPFSNIIFKSRLLDFSFFSYLLSISFAVISFYLIFKVARKSITKYKKVYDSSGSDIISVGLLFIVIPTLIISISPKYQQETTWGSPYTPVLYVCVGLGIISIYIIRKFFDKRIFAAIISSYACVSYGFNIPTNYYVNESLNSFWNYPRNVAMESLRAGILGDMPDRSVLLTSINYPWSIAPFYYQYGGKKLDQKFYQGAPGMVFSPHRQPVNFLLTNKKPGDLDINLTEIDDFPYLKSNISFYDGFFYHFSFDESSRAYFFNYSSVTKDNGAIVACRLRSLVANQGEIAGAYCDDFNIYLQEPARTHNNRSLVTRFRVDTYAVGTNKFLGNFILDQSLFRVSASKNGYLYKFVGNKQILIDPKSISVDRFNIEPNRSMSWSHSVFGDLMVNAEDKPIALNHSTLLLRPIPKNQPFELRLKFALTPTINNFQSEFANIIGNHPGTGFEGFVIQKKYQSKNEYTVNYGDGKKWIEAAIFNLEDSLPHEIIIVVDSKSVKVYFDGKIIGNSLGHYSNSEMPLHLGGAIGGGRYFIGNVYSLRVKKLYE